MNPILECHRFQFVSFCDVYHAKPFAAMQLFGDYHLIHIIRGTAEITIDDTVYPVAAGMAAAIPPGARYYISVSSDFIMRNIHFMLFRANGTPMEDEWILPFVFTPDNFDQTAKQLESLCALDCVESKAQIQAAALAHEIVLEHWNSEKLQPGRPELIEHRIEVMRDILLDPQRLRRCYDAQEFAHACNLSTSQVNRIFANTFKSSPKIMWEKHRLAAVCRELLTNLDAQIVDIAEAFGFEDASYFSRWFRRLLEQTPKQYRDSVLPPSARPPAMRLNVHNMRP